MNWEVAFGCAFALLLIMLFLVKWVERKNRKTRKLKESQGAR